MLSGEEKTASSSKKRRQTFYPKRNFKEELQSSDVSLDDTLEHVFPHHNEENRLVIAALAGCVKMTEEIADEILSSYTMEQRKQARILLADDINKLIELGISNDTRINNLMQDENRERPGIDDFVEKNINYSILLRSFISNNKAVINLLRSKDNKPPAIIIEKTSDIMEKKLKWLQNQYDRQTSTEEATYRKLIAKETLSQNFDIVEILKRQEEDTKQRLNLSYKSEVVKVKLEAANIINEKLKYIDKQISNVEINTPEGQRMMQDLTLFALDEMNTLMVLLPIVLHSNITGSSLNSSKRQELLSELTYANEIQEQISEAINVFNELVTLIKQKNNNLDSKINEAASSDVNVTDKSLATGNKTIPVEKASYEELVLTSMEEYTKPLNEEDNKPIDVIREIRRLQDIADKKKTYMATLSSSGIYQQLKPLPAYISIDIKPSDVSENLIGKKPGPDYRREKEVKENSIREKLRQEFFSSKRKNNNEQADNEQTSNSFKKSGLVTTAASQRVNNDFTESIARQNAKQLRHETMALLSKAPPNKVDVAKNDDENQATDNPVTIQINEAFKNLKIKKTFTQTVKPKSRFEIMQDSFNVNEFQSPELIAKLESRRKENIAQEAKKLVPPEWQHYR